MKVTHRKGAMLGALAAGLAVASVAAGGSGIGGIFNLGEVNTVDAKTSLAGSTNDPQLEVINNDTGPQANAITAFSQSDLAPTIQAVNGVGIGLWGTGGGAYPGVFGETASDAAYAAGVRGRATAMTPAVGDNSGVHGDNMSTNSLGQGVLGTHGGTGVGVRGTSAEGTGVSGTHAATIGTQPGVLGTTASMTSAAAGVRGEVTAAGGSSSGVLGVNGSSAATAAGVSGWNTGQGNGVFGNAGQGAGVKGQSQTIGVLGLHTGPAGTDPGVRGETASSSSNAVGVHGLVASTSPGGSSSGVRGENAGTGSSGIGVWGSQDGAGYGVYGFTPTGLGVYGRSTSGSGVRGLSFTGNGVHGVATNYTGVFGEHTSTAGVEPGVRGDTASQDSHAVGVLGRVSSTAPGGYSAAVRGENMGASNSGIGVWGSHDGGGWGVYGESHSGIGVRAESSLGTGLYGQSGSGRGVWGKTTNGIGVYGQGTSGWAGYFSGNVHVAGTLSKAAGSFRIDHPLDPKNKYLSHSFVESPEMMNVYNGNAVTDANGAAIVRLPDYFQALNREFRYQLTPIGKFAQAIVAKEISANRFTIRTDKPSVKVSWQVTGVRKDRYAEAHRIQVERAKPKSERGTYLHPELYGK